MQRREMINDSEIPLNKHDRYYIVAMHIDGSQTVGISHRRARNGSGSLNAIYQLFGQVIVLSDRSAARRDHQLQLGADVVLVRQVFFVGDL